MTIRFSQAVFSGAIVSTLTLLGLVAQPVRAQVSDADHNSFNTEISNSCGDHHGDHGDHSEHPEQKN